MRVISNGWLSFLDQIQIVIEENDTKSRKSLFTFLTIISEKAKMVKSEKNPTFS
jgi:hypothetical protein